MNDKSFKTAIIIISVSNIIIAPIFLEKFGLNTLVSTLLRSILISIPIVSLYAIMSSKGMIKQKTNSIGIIFVPIGLFFWPWLHKKSEYFEMYAALVFACIAIGLVLVDRFLVKYK